MKEKKFRVGDMVTYKNTVDCVNSSGEQRYYYGGQDHGGFRGYVTEYLDYVSGSGCYQIIVSTDNTRTITTTVYMMLESEFMEWDEQITYHGNGFKHKFI